jgi:hypothetical protein
MKDEIEKILDEAFNLTWFDEKHANYKSVFRDEQFVDCSAKILNLFTSTIDSCEDEILHEIHQYYDEAYLMHKKIINIIKDKVRGNK